MEAYFMAFAWILMMVCGKNLC